MGIWIFLDVGLELPASGSELLELELEVLLKIRP